MKKLVSLFFICSSLISSAKTIWVCDSSTTYTWKNNDWSISSKSVFEYDNNGNQTQYISYTWNNDWKVSQKATFEYNGNGYLS